MAFCREKNQKLLFKVGSLLNFLNSFNFLICESSVLYIHAIIVEKAPHNLEKESAQLEKYFFPTGKLSFRSKP